MEVFELLESDHCKAEERHLTDPQSHPQYNSEWVEFIKKRSSSIWSFGMDSHQYDFAEEFKVIFLLLINVTCSYYHLYMVSFITLLN